MRNANRPSTSSARAVAPASDCAMRRFSLTDALENEREAGVRVAILLRRFRWRALTCSRRGQRVDPADAEAEEEAEDGEAVLLPGQPGCYGENHHNTACDTHRVGASDGVAHVAHRAHAEHTTKVRDRCDRRLVLGAPCLRDVPVVAGLRDEHERDAHGCEVVLNTRVGHAVRPVPLRPLPLEERARHVGERLLHLGVVARRVHFKQMQGERRGRFHVAR